MVAASATSASPAYGVGWDEAFVDGIVEDHGEDGAE